MIIFYRLWNISREVLVVRYTGTTTDSCDVYGDYKYQVPAMRQTTLMHSKRVDFRLLL